MAEPTFILKKGAVLRTPGVAEVVSHKNITEERVLKHLAAAPAKIRLLESYPQNWKKLVEKYKKDAETPEIGSETTAPNTGAKSRRQRGGSKKGNEAKAAPKSSDSATPDAAPETETGSNETES